MAKEVAVSPALNRLSQFYLPHVEGLAMQLYYAQRQPDHGHWPAITPNQRRGFREAAAGMLRELRELHKQALETEVVDG